MSNLQPRTTASSPAPAHGADLLSSVGRYSPTGRALSRLQSQHVVRAAAVHSETLIQEDKISSLTSVGRTAQTEVAMLTQLEQQLTQAVPLAASRLEALGQITTLGVAEVVADTAAKLRRL